jgi:hypothetical protein
MEVAPCHTPIVDDYEARLNAKLAPESMTRTLIQAGAFLSAYELIRLQVVDGVRDFFWTGREDNGKKVLCPDYETDVVVRAKNRFTASVSWLVENGALTQEQADVLEEVHRHRHEIAHELPKILIDPDFEVNSALLLAAAVVLRRLGVFWGRFTVDADPQWDNVEVRDEDIRSGPDLLMGSLIEIAGLLPDDAVPG